MISKHSGTINQDMLNSYNREVITSFNCFNSVETTFMLYAARQLKLDLRESGYRFLDICYRLTAEEFSVRNIVAEYKSATVKY